MVYSTVFMPYEVGDYSIYVHENLEGILQVGIIAEKPQDNPIYTYWTKEIVASPEGSILYFNEKLEISSMNILFLTSGFTCEMAIHNF